MELWDWRQNVKITVDKLENHVSRMIQTTCQAASVMPSTYLCNMFTNGGATVTGLRLCMPPKTWVS